MGEGGDGEDQVADVAAREIDRQLAQVVLEWDDVLEVVEGELVGGSVSSGGGGRGKTKQSR